MSSPVPCRHCNGTSYCGGFKRDGAVLMGQTCLTCLRKAGLSHLAKLSGVDCSVCGGTGHAPARSSPRPRNDSLLPLVLFSGILVFLVGLVATLSIQAGMANRDTAESREQTEDKASGLPTEVALKDIKDQVLGKSEQEVKDQLGSPSSTESSPSESGATERWYYERQDGKLTITLEDGRVKEASGP